MRIKRTFITILAAFAVIIGIAASDAFGQGRSRGNARFNRDSNRYILYQPQRHRGWKHKKYTHGYRNYGQYRRTQVGNRRYRLVKRYYWNNGIRRQRYIRIYF